MRSNRPSSGSGAPRMGIPIAVLSGALFLTLVETVYVGHATRVQDRMKWQHSVQTSVRELQTEVASRLSSYIALLRGGCGLFSSEGIVTREQFHSYVERLELERNYPGVLGVGFAPRLKRTELAAVIQNARDDGLPNYRVWPPGERDDYVPVLYLERADPGRPNALGFDMYSEASRRNAMDAARDQGRAAATGRVILAREPEQEKNAGFLIYLPVYRGGGVPGRVEERRTQLIGYLYSAFRADQLMASVIDGLPELAVDFALYDQTPRPNSALISSVPDSGAMLGNAAALKIALEVSETTWTLMVVPRANLLEENFWSRSISVLGVGVAISVGLFALTLAQTRARGAAEHARQAAEQTAAELRRSEEALRESLAERRRGEEDRARLLQSEQAARAEAEAANRSKDEFLATLSHELRTPLNAIMGWAQLLRMGGLDGEEVARGVETIERNAKLQAQLVEDLLDVSRIISGKLRLALKPLTLPRVIEAALDSIRPAAVAKGIKVIPLLDSAAGPVLGDADRLQQVVWNLLSNAIKFTPSRGRVELLLQRVDDQAELLVTDTGQGIAPDFLPFVFDRLRQQDGSSTRRHGGIGLGLAIVRHLVELHGGSVSVRSRGPGMGTTFAVLLPIASPAADGADAKPGHAPGGADPQAESAGELSGARVLVVEDEPDARELLERILVLAGAQVTVAGAAGEAFRQFQAAPPDVIVSDISMPEEDGYSLIRRIRALHASAGGAVPAVALTAFAREEDRQAARTAGFDAHMAKPFDPADLVVAVARLWRREEDAPAASLAITERSL